MKRYVTTLWLATFSLFIVAGSTSTVWAAPDTDLDSSKKATSELDQQLLDNLDNQLLDGVLDDVGRAADKPDRGSAQPEGEDIGAPAEDDPLRQIGEQMRDVEQRLEKRDASASQRQQRIVDDLSRLIDELERQACARCNSSSQQNTAASEQKAGQGKSKGAKPGSQGAASAARESSARLRKPAATRTGTASARDLMKGLWGELPVRDRNQLLQSAPEEFLPKYELLIEQYYRRLAEEQEKESR